MQDLYDALTAGMTKTDFAARRDLLAANVAKDFDLGLMTRIIVGPTWRSLSESDHQQLVAAFTAYSVATYAHEFTHGAGVKFTVSPQPTPAAQGGVLVQSQIIPSDSPAVPIAYLVRDENGQPRIIDVLLNGTISQLAARRSEYSATLRQGGAQALITALKQKTDEISK